MRELDFEMFVGQDAGRALYRAVFLFGSFYAFRQVYTQMNPISNMWMNFVEAELWTASRCFIQMKPRFRLAYSAILCSFLPYLSRMAYERYSNRQLCSIIECSLIGSLNGASLMGLCLTLNPSIVASAALIGGIYGAVYSLALR